MSTSQPSCLRLGLDWCLNKMQQCLPCQCSVHRIPTVPLSPLFWPTRDTKVMQSHSDNGNSDATFFPSLTLTQLYPLFYQSLRCLHHWLVLLHTRMVLEEVFSFRHALSLHFIPKLTYNTITPAGRSDQSEVSVLMPTASALGKGWQRRLKMTSKASPHTAPRLSCFFILYFFFFLEGTGNNDLNTSPLPTIPAQSHFRFYTFSL